MKKICTPTVYRQELKGKILEAAMLEFAKKGIRAVKMDDIATILSISKRTLYEIYSNKEDLLLEGIRMKHEERERHFKDFIEHSGHN
ncbi:MAG TPA: helix-turn-helix domain-containing protein, partial [Prevotella sp.]